MDEDLSIIAEEFAKIRFFLGAFFVILYLAVVVATLYFWFTNPLAMILVIFEILFGFVLIAQYATMLEKLRKRRKKMEKKAE